MREGITGPQQLDGAWVAYLDAFGFSAASEKQSEELIGKFFSEIYERLASAKPTITAAYQFSDSIFLVQKPFPEPHKKLHELYATIQDLQKIALQYKLIFRGAIAFGAVGVGPFGCFGQPVIEAARLEAHLAVPLVALPERFIDRANEHLREVYSESARVELTTQQVKTKTGAILANVVLPPLRLFANLAHKRIRESLLYGPDYVAAAWQSAIEAFNLRERDEQQK